ncbi:translation initiation factor IF-2-like isoform X2 [Thrips palmi]|uniref:Translation initiation factor IF-2-like isoform X2 n=1 Tax=Thrips palmi TaxID=161013 RepID=A0A6P8YD02_THRPL|nr:translation initiation factor IF-2-like isoform X2 [Thrips palmi]
MCTTYTWLAYGLPDRRQQRAAHPAAPMAGIREEDEAEAGEEAGCPRRHPYAPGPGGRPRRARHWMGLAIVGVQMAAWCLVGALLMHRGVTTLKRRDAALMRDAFAVLPAAPSTAMPAMPAMPGWTMQDDVIAESSPSAAPSSSASPATPTPTPAPTPDPDDEAAGNALETSWNDLMKRWSSFVPSRPVPGLHAPRDDSDGLGDGSPFGPAPGPAPGPATGGLPGMGKTGTGAATAVVMVTVGGVMLVVGPAFMFIKIMDVYQRQKRLSKLSQHDDPPPSYDEVAEKAPRYSALFQVLENGELTPLSLPADGADGEGGPSGPSGAAPADTSASGSTSTVACSAGPAGPAPAEPPGTARGASVEAAPESSASAPRTSLRGASAPTATTKDLEQESRRSRSTTVSEKTPADEDTEKGQADVAVDDKSRRRSV